MPIKMPENKTTEVNVSLYSSGGNNSQRRAEKNGYLEIRERSSHHLEFTPNVLKENGVVLFKKPHEIKFVLTEGDLTFCDLGDDRNPGFIWTGRWLGNDPGQIFDNIKRSDDGKSISMKNNHFVPESEPNHTCGHWHYQLFACNSSGDIYGIPWTSCNGSADSNPSIRNR